MINLQAINLVMTMHLHLFGATIMKKWSVNEIVIGSCLDSLVFCEQKDAILLSVGPTPPQFFEESYVPWHEKMFSLSLRGKVPFHKAIKSIKIRDNRATVIYGNGLYRDVLFNRCYVFSDHCLKLENELMAENNFARTVYDFFEISKFESHEIDTIHDTDDFVSKIIFYDSGRLGRKTKSDIVTVSKIFAANFLDFDYTDTSCRFKARKMIEDKGIRAVVNRVDKTTGKVYRDRIKLSFVDRLIVNNDTRKYKPSRLVKFPNKICRVR